MTDTQKVLDGLFLHHVEVTEGQLRIGDGVQAVVLGPGLSQNHDTVSFVLSLIDMISKPCVIDADGLNALAKNPEALQGQANRSFVLTPHPRELSRLTNETVEVIQSDRIGAALAAARKFGSVIVLKGHYSVIASPTGQVFINPTGNSGMATAGAGDVLSGMIGGLMARGSAALRCGGGRSLLAGKAGDLAANRPELAGAQASLVATDILGPYSPGSGKLTGWRCILFGRKTLAIRLQFID
ncbi:MAG: NAD(P)H-hydrate dehydratase [Candidatus Competibacteraceae bacterium]|nr:NAD(P)H-hydrate dehydratase [Candidatus Competibacteraceae bacterium]